MMSRVQGKVLVVDPDYNTLGTLSRALRARGHHVTLCADGRQGLQRAVESAPDIVLVDRAVPVVDVQTFIEVLRDNPRTSGSQVFVLGTNDPVSASGLDMRVQTLIKPFHVAEIVARIESVLRARLAPKRDPELKGDLEQVALFDLLQVFSANRRTGVLRVEAAGATGELAVRDGRVVDCAYRGAQGEKALYRLLAASEGQFVFHPDMAAARESIEAGTDMLLMEAVRQADEVEHLASVIPNRTAQVAVSRQPDAPGEMARRIVTALGQDTMGIDELLDMFPDSDLDVMNGLRELLEANALVVLDSGSQRTRLCEEDEEVVLRASALKLRAAGLDGPPRLAILNESYQDLARLTRALNSVEGFVSEASPPTIAGSGSMGPLGTLRVAGVEIELYALPTDVTLRPIWGLFLASVRAAVWLGEDFDTGARELLRTLRVGVVPAGSGWEHPQGAAQTLRSALTMPAHSSSSTRASEY